jgi:hypothetical protein
MSRLTLALVLLPAAALAGNSDRHFEVEASFTPPGRPGVPGEVAVTFHPLDPDLRINERPAPRLRLDLLETVLEDRQPPQSEEAPAPAYDPLKAKYLDLGKPVRFPVSVLPTASSGESLVRASIVFFYCSVREDWCRRGSVSVEIPVRVP